MQAIQNEEGEDKYFDDMKRELIHSKNENNIV